MKKLVMSLESFSKENSTKKLQDFVNSYLCHVIRVLWPKTLLNEVVRRLMGQILVDVFSIGKRSASSAEDGSVVKIKLKVPAAKILIRRTNLKGLGETRAIHLLVLSTNIS